MKTAWFVLLIVFGAPRLANGQWIESKENESLTAKDRIYPQTEFKLGTKKLHVNFSYLYPDDGPVRITVSEVLKSSNLKIIGFFDFTESIIVDLKLWKYGGSEDQFYLILVCEYASHRQVLYVLDLGLDKFNKAQIGKNSVSHNFVRMLLEKHSEYPFEEYQLADKFRRLDIKGHYLSQPDGKLKDYKVNFKPESGKK